MAQERKKNKQQQTEAQRLAHRKAVIEHSDNKFVAELTKNMDAFIYTKDFYVALLVLRQEKVPVKLRFLY